MKDLEMVKLAKKFRHWKIADRTPDLWMGDDYAFSPQGFSKRLTKRSIESLAFCEAAPEFILRLLDGAVQKAIEDAEKDIHW